ncbi:MAG: LamG domain-containing protein, partial [Candidatus Paceibacterota bacterium]
NPTTQTYELTTILESNKYRLGGSADTVSTDGGSTSYLYEQGTNLTLHPITDSGLVGYWTFDEGTGTQALDSSGNNNTGTLTNSPTWQQANNCKVGGCLLFNYGSYTYVSIPEPVNNSFDFGLSQSFSVSIFGKIQNPTTYHSFLGKCGQDNSCPGYEFFLNSNTLDFRMTWTGGPSYGVDTTASYDIGDGGWHHIVAVVDRITSKVFIYVDGILRNNGGNISSVGNIDNSTNLRIGASGAGPWNGPIDDVRIYNRALSAAEVLSIYNSTK